MDTQRLPFISVLLVLPLTITSCDRPGSPAEPTTALVAAATAPGMGEPGIADPPTRPICSISPMDGHAAIMAAIGSCPDGSTIVFPLNASYTITDRIEVKNRTDLIIDGNGSTFTNTRPPAIPNGAHKPNWWLETNTNLVVKNMTVIGAFDPSIPRPGSPPIWHNMQWEHGFTVVGGNGIWIQDVVVNNVWGEFVCTQPVAGLEGRGGEPRNVHIERLTGSGAGRNGVAFVGCVDCWLENSTLANLFFFGVDLEPDVPNELVQNIHIRNVAINGVYGSPIVIPFKFVPGQIANIEIRGLTMSQPSDICYGAVQIGYPEQQTNTTVIQGVVIEDSQLKSRYHGLVLKDIGSGSVRNNTIASFGPDVCGPPARLPVYLINAPTLTVSGNTTVGY